MSPALLDGAVSPLAAPRASRVPTGFVKAVHRFGLRLAQRRARARAVAVFAELDARTLRDIGLHACEVESYWAETEGLVEITRLRVRRAVDQRGA